MAARATDAVQTERLQFYRDVFHRFARVEAPDLASPMYAELAYGVSGDAELVAMASRKRKRQPAPNMLFAAVQYLLLNGAEHPLTAHYPIISGAERPMQPAFPLFRDFCLEHRDEILELLGTRATQTNVVRRCTCLLPAFSIVSREAGGAPLALIDLGASAGLNLNFDRYGYRYQRGGAEVLRWGEADARVGLEAELLGVGTPDLARSIDVVRRVGVDTNPIDLRDHDQLTWLRALIWPEHVERHQRLVEAAAELERQPIELLRGDGAELLPRLIADVPSDAALVVYATVALYQFSRDARRKVEAALAAASETRDLWFVTLDGVDIELRLSRYRGGSAQSELLARTSAHGWWIDWQAA